LQVFTFIRPSEVVVSEHHFQEHSSEVTDLEMCLSNVFDKLDVEQQVAVSDNVGHTPNEHELQNGHVLVRKLEHELLREWGALGCHGSVRLHEHHCHQQPSQHLKHYQKSSRGFAKNVKQLQQVDSYYQQLDTRNFLGVIVGV